MKTTVNDMQFSAIRKGTTYGTEYWNIELRWKPVVVLSMRIGPSRAVSVAWCA